MNITNKLITIVNCEEEFVVINNEKILLQDIIEQPKLLDMFNKEFDKLLLTEKLIVSAKIIHKGLFK